MTNNGVLFFSLFISILIFSSKCYSSQQRLIPTLNFGYSEFAPYTYTNKNGLASGDVTDIVKKVVTSTDYKFIAVAGANRRLFRNMLADKIDILMVVPFKNADSDKLIFGENVSDILDLTVFWLQGEAPDITEINQLQKKALIAIAGYSYGGVFRENGPLKNTQHFLLETHPRALQALMLGRAPYLLAYMKPAMFYVEPERKQQLSSYVFGSIPLVLSIRRSYPNAEKVLNQLEKRYAELFPERFHTFNPSLPLN